jgi:hypothetical protein
MATPLSNLPPDILAKTFAALPPQTLRTARLACASFRDASVLTISHLNAHEWNCGPDLVSAARTFPFLKSLSIGTVNPCWRRLLEVPTCLQRLQALTYRDPSPLDQKQVLTTSNPFSQVCVLAESLRADLEDNLPALLAACPQLVALNLQLHATLRRRTSMWLRPTLNAALQLRGLQELVMSPFAWNRSSSRYWESILIRLHELPHLQSLGTVTVWGDMDLRGLAALTRLTRLDVELAWDASFFSCLEKLTVLGSLSLCASGEAPADLSQAVQEFRRVLRTLQSLQSLRIHDVSPIGLVYDGYWPWAAVAVPSLTRLVVQPAVECGPLLFAALSGLRHLDVRLVGRNTDWEIDTLTRKITAVEHLNLSLNPRLCGVLFGGLSCLTRMTHLQVTSWTDEDHGIRGPTEANLIALSRLTRLRELQLEWVLHEGLEEATIRWLALLTNLQSLSLSINHVRMVSHQESILRFLAKHTWMRSLLLCRWSCGTWARRRRVQFPKALGLEELRPLLGLKLLQNFQCDGAWTLKQDFMMELKTLRRGLGLPTSMSAYSGLGR